MDQYLKYKAVLSGKAFPHACLDVELLKKNIASNLARAGNKRIRIASKSIRCPEVMRMIFDFSEQFQGIMAYHGKEVLFLAEQGNGAMGTVPCPAQLVVTVLQVHF